VEMFQSTAPLESAPREAMPSPGIGLRHYAPSARLILIEAQLTQLPHRLAQTAVLHANEKIGLMLPTEIPTSALPGTTIFDWGSWAAPEELARNLYAGLRALDSQGCTVILCPMPPEDGIGAATRDRLRKAAH
jgi:L-threonylcarbamoyladenylate synthase